MGILSLTEKPTSGVQYEEDGVTAFVDKEEIGKGKLLIAEDLVYWVKADSQGFSIPYPAISLHAVSRDLSAFPRECLYLMIDSDLADFGDETEKMDDDDDDDSEESGTKISEIRFVPDNGQVLETLFEAMSSCQLLHPDPEDDMSEEEGPEADEEEDEGVEEDYADAEEEGGGDAASGMSELKISDQVNGHGEGSAQNGVIDSRNLVNSSAEVGQFDDADMEPDH